jgi:hypothetical protein
MKILLRSTQLANFAKSIVAQSSVKGYPGCKQIGLAFEDPCAMGHTTTGSKGRGILLPLRGAYF